MNNRNFLDEIKHQYQYGGMHIKLIFVNVLIFFIIGLLSVIGRLLLLPDIELFLANIFTLQSDFSSFLFKPWGLLTSIFAHFGFLHLIFNMMMLFFAGKLFESYFGSYRLLAIYLLGGVTGGLFEIVAHSFVPALADQSSVIVGASGSIMAIFIGLAFYKPNLVVSLFGLLDLKIIYLALIYIVYDFLSLGLNDGTAHFAHLGGAIIGLLAAQKTGSSSNITVRFEQFIRNFEKLIKGRGLTKKAKPVKHMTDEEFNVTKKANQSKIDEILDKISKSGYESLSKAEKEFLFKQSKN